ncbi:hypothetical protein AWH62_01325 [Maricaulis sp. W15]|uniref:hypothetical protein n=1 Tax=Maricaulis sp. W15 TaxID=1772333 RepID=UPI000948F3BC|nr:hypothetical protein [Maricaulis sp. W15]OLF81341.1 hypothetical protein AWH62_01325 [Maricaulis sp. W15]
MIQWFRRGLELRGLFLRSLSFNGSMNPVAGREDWALMFVGATIIFVANANYISDLYLLWHDDATSYFQSSLNHMMRRGGGTVTRHLIVDNFLAQIMTNVSPFAARLVLIAVGGVPLFLTAYWALRLGFSLAPAGAALAASLPLVIVGQWEIFIGINLSYVVFDVAFFFVCILFLVYGRHANNWPATVIVSALIAFTISDGISSSVLLVPAIFWAALFIRPKSLLQSALICFSIILVTTKVVREQSSLGRAEWAGDPLRAVLSNFATPIDTVLPGGELIAWVVLLALFAMAVGAIYFAILKKEYELLAIIGFAAAVYVVPIIIYSIGRGGFPNRYSFISVVGLSCSVGVMFQIVASFVRGALSAESAGGQVSTGPSFASGVVVLCVLALGFQKSIHVEQHIGVISRRIELVSNYLHYASRGPIQAGVDIRPQDQLILVAENNFPYLYPHRGPGLGFLRFVTSNLNVVGYAGRRRLCADPFSPWESFWSHGPGGLTVERPIRIVGFFGPNGEGAELSHLLSTQGGSLDGPWTLYQTGDFGARPVGEGEGRETLEALLAGRDLEPHEIAFSCGL